MRDIIITERAKNGTKKTATKDTEYRKKLVNLGFVKIDENRKQSTILLYEKEKTKDPRVNLLPW